MQIQKFWHISTHRSKNYRQKEENCELEIKTAVTIGHPRRHPKTNPNTKYSIPNTKYKIQKTKMSKKTFRHNAWPQRCKSPAPCSIPWWRGWCLPKLLLLLWCYFFLLIIIFVIEHCNSDHYCYCYCYCIISFVIVIEYCDYVFDRMVFTSRWLNIVINIFENKS